MLSYLIKLVTLVVLILHIESSSAESSESTSYDSLIASQCRARCFSLYPWKTLNNTSAIDRKHRSFRFKRAFSSSLSNNSSGILSSDSSTNHVKHPPHNNVKWHKVMEMCSKNTNCLQCSLPCDLPTNLLPNCKYLCKNQNPLCIESCNLLNKLNEEKYGSCPNLIGSSQSVLISSLAQPDECTNSTSKLAAQARALRHNNEDSPFVEKSLNECNLDSDCIDVRKCCNLNAKCPEQGKVCLRPQINNQNLPSIPFNLTIVERKKGKTVILSWDCVYNKNKPTIFVVEGRWSLKPPQSDSNTFDSSDPDSYMTKWGYLAQSANNNWTILRNINRGRWYKFRVAAISKSGTYGYSKPTELFILSSAPKPPSEPQNLTVTQVSSSSKSDSVNVDISWLPSKRSDLPIINYKVTWKRRALLNNSSKLQPDYESDDDTEPAYSSSADLSTVNTPEYGSDLIDAQSSNKYTITNLQRFAIYSIELVAISSYDKDFLVSTAQRVKLDTSNFYPTESQAASLLVAEETSTTPSRLNESDDDDEDDEDDDLDAQNPAQNSHSSERNQRLIIETTPQTNEFKRALIRNLSVQTAYFQNGLVKAKLSWQLEDTNSKSKNHEEISINSISDQPMFTITWFAIKCISATTQEVLPHKQLPTPITATTINTNFEIYELKYNCDYVVNVRQTNSNQISSSLQPQQAPQIASTQFKVPSCNLIKLIGRIKPICYSAASNDQFRETIQANNDIYQFILNERQETTTRTTSTISTTTVDVTSILNPLPRVYNIRHRVVERRNSNSKFYSVEFAWSLPNMFSKKMFNGFQISVVPKAIPGMSVYQQNYEEDFVSFGSVGAIVDKDQQSFVVRQLRPAIKYIFQIQLIGLDNQSYGPASSLEFLINDEEKDVRKQSQQDKKAISLHHSRTDYDQYDDVNTLFLTTSKSNQAVASSSLSSSNFFLNNSKQLHNSVNLAVFLIFISMILNRLS